MGTTMLVTGFEWRVVVLGECSAEIPGQFLCLELGA